MMPFQVVALSEQEFVGLFSMDDRALRERGAKRYIADRTPGFPCRVSLEDASPGEVVILAPFVHQPADSPYKASGPIFVRNRARRASPGIGDVPELLRSRLLSVRAYDDASLMREADVVNGRELEAVVERMFGDSGNSYLHVHFARPGCYACRIDRA
jgi:hypothetical protein